MTCPLPRYYFCHVAIALLIAVALWPFVGLPGGLAAGAAVYVSREVTQWQMGLPFDWKGLLYPVVTCGLLIVLTNIVA